MILFLDRIVRMNRNFHPYGFTLALLIHIVILVCIFYLITSAPEKELTKNSPSRLSLNIGNFNEDIDQYIRPSDIGSIQSDLSKKHYSTPDIKKTENKPPIHRDVIKEDAHQIPKNISESIKRHYGDEFYDLTVEEQKYILDNLKTIRKINEIVGTRLLRSKPSNEIDPTDSNIVEFYLHPDGSISDLYLYEDRTGNMLDELTLDTIRLAHSKYPKPKTRTLIRIRVWILVKE